MAPFVKSCSTTKIGNFVDLSDLRIDSPCLSDSLVCTAAEFISYESGMRACPVPLQASLLFTLLPISYVPLGTCMRTKVLQLRRFPLPLGPYQHDLPMRERYVTSNKLSLLFCRREGGKRDVDVKNTKDTLDFY